MRISDVDIARLVLSGTNCRMCERSMSTIDPRQKQYIIERDGRFCDEKNICEHFKGWME